MSTCNIPIPGLVRDHLAAADRAAQLEERLRLAREDLAAAEIDLVEQKEEEDDAAAGIELDPLGPGDDHPEPGPLDLGPDAGPHDRHGPHYRIV